jgi:hypothetical protein
MGGCVTAESARGSLQQVQCCPEVVAIDVGGGGNTLC